MLVPLIGEAQNLLETLVHHVVNTCPTLSPPPTKEAPRVHPDSSFLELHSAWKSKSRGRFWVLAETSQTITIFYKVTCSSFSEKPRLHRSLRVRGTLHS